MTLAGRVALVTGGGRGIGRAISLGLAADGAAVAVNYRRDEAAALATAEEITADGGRAAAFAASVDEYEDDARMIAAVHEQLGPVDLLVNNAGVASRGLTVADTEPFEPDLTPLANPLSPVNRLLLDSLSRRRSRVRVPSLP